MPKARLTKGELPEIISNIERTGGDASELREILEDKTPRESIDDVPDDEFIEMLRADSPVEEGEALECSTCRIVCSRLTSGVCDECFAPWALKGKKTYLAAKKKKE